MRDLLKFLAKLDVNQINSFGDKVQAKHDKLIAASDEPSFFDFLTKPSFMELPSDFYKLLRLVDFEFNEATKSATGVVGQDERQNLLDSYITIDLLENGFNSYAQAIAALEAIIDKLDLYKNYLTDYLNKFGNLNLENQPDLENATDEERQAFEDIKQRNEIAKSKNIYYQKGLERDDLFNKLWMLDMLLQAKVAIKDRIEANRHQYKADLVIEKLKSSGSDCLAALEISLVKQANAEKLMPRYIDINAQSDKTFYDLDTFFGDMENPNRSFDAEGTFFLASDKFKGLADCYREQKKLVDILEDKEEPTKKLVNFRSQFLNRETQRALKKNPEPAMKKFYDMVVYVLSVTFTLGIYGLFKPAPAAPNQRYAKHAERKVKSAEAKGIIEPRRRTL